MKKWLAIAFTILLIGIAAAIPLKVHAANPQVHITVSAWVVGSPSGLTLTYVSDNQIDISWTKGVGAVNTMVRVKYDSVPMDRSDGYQVYYGVGDNVTDSNVDLTSPRVPYYKAWSQNALGAWELLGTSAGASFMSLSYMWLGLIILALAASAGAFIWRRTLLCIIAAFVWLALTGFAVTNLDMTIVANISLPLLFLFCFVTMLASTWFLRPERQALPPANPHQYMIDLQNETDTYRKLRRRQY